MQVDLISYLLSGWNLPTKPIKKIILTLNFNLASFFFVGNKLKMLILKGIHFTF